MEPTLTDRETALLASACLAAIRTRDETQKTTDTRAVIAEVALSPSLEIPESAVNKAVEERVLPSHLRAHRRHFPEAGVLYLAFIHSRAVSFDRALKKEIFQWLSRILSDAAHGKEITGLRLSLTPLVVVHPNNDHVRICLDLLADYQRLRKDYIASDPSVMGGAPIIKGTRIPAYAILGRVEGGDTLEDLSRDYPELPREAFEAAIAYARTHPRPGRPRRYR